MARLMLSDELWFKLKEITLQHRIYNKPRVFDICSTTRAMTTFHGLSAESIDPADKPRGVGFTLKCQQTLTQNGMTFMKKFVAD